jgi:hypothetical protein
MGIVLMLSGRVVRRTTAPLALEAVREWLTRVAVWFEEQGDLVVEAQLGRDAEERPVLRVCIHPAGSPLEIRLETDGWVRVHAITTPIGPGYHRWVCDLLRRWAQEYAIQWVPDECRDDSGYFWRQDVNAVENLFVRWLQRECQRHPHSPGLTGEYEYTYPAEVLTPLGPRAADWLQAVAREAALAPDFFPWWNPDDLAAFYRNRALVNLWCHYPWRPPLNEAEGERTDQIAADLATAFQLEPAADLPWAEWLELLHHISEDAACEHFCVTPDDHDLSIRLWMRAGPVPNPRHPPLGYRRYPVWVRLDGGWRLRVPGDFLCEWDEQRNWTAWNRERAVWFRRLGFQRGNGPVRSAQELLEFGRQTIQGEGEPIGEPASATAAFGSPCRWAVYGPMEEDGRSLWRLMGVAAVDGQLVLCNVYMQDGSDLPWALQIWHSLQHQATDNQA